MFSLLIIHKRMHTNTSPGNSWIGWFAFVSVGIALMFSKNLICYIFLWMLFSSLILFAYLCDRLYFVRTCFSSVLHFNWMIVENRMCVDGFVRDNGQKIIIKKTNRGEEKNAWIETGHYCHYLLNSFCIANEPSKTRALRRLSSWWCGSVDVFLWHESYTDEGNKIIISCSQIISHHHRCMSIGIRSYLNSLNDATNAWNATARASCVQMNRRLKPKIIQRTSAWTWKKAMRKLKKKCHKMQVHIHILIICFPFPFSPFFSCRLFISFLLLRICWWCSNFSFEKVKITQWVGTSKSHAALGINNGLFLLKW